MLGALNQLTPEWHPPPPKHSHSLIPHGQGCADLGMCLQGSESTGRPTALTRELRPSEQAWRSDVQGGKHLLQHRGLKTDSVGLHFLPPRNILSPAACGLSFAYNCEVLAGRSFFSGKVP